MLALSREIQNIDLEVIYVGERLRHVDQDRVAALASSIKEIGLITPLTIRMVDEMEINGKTERDVPVLISGYTRMQALTSLGIDSAPCIEVTADDIEAQLWEIAENLHRSELTALERGQHIAKWIELNAARVLFQSETKSRGRPITKGIRAAQRDLGIGVADASRSIKVASLTDEAKNAARATGLDDNRTALLKAARAAPGEQADVIRHIAEQKAAKLADDPLNDFEAKERQIATLMAAWNKASPEARAEFLERIDKPLMDRRFA